MVEHPVYAWLTMQGYSYVPPHDDEALMEAVYSRGTIAISLDASQPSFRFYASGGRSACCHQQLLYAMEGPAIRHRTV